jgi:hypothetical protein
MEEGMKIEDVVNKNSKFETIAIAESEVKNIKKGEIIQFERRGFFICDKEASESEDGLITFNFIPDGKSKSMSVISTKVDAKMSAKGNDDGKGKQKKEKKEKKEKPEKEENNNNNNTNTNNNTTNNNNTNGEKTKTKENKQVKDDGVVTDARCLFTFGF